MSDKALALAAEFLIEGPLTRPLVFGDTEQIAAVHAWQGKLCEATGDPEVDEQEWEVTYTAEHTITVVAGNAEEAEEMAYDEADGDMVDVIEVRAKRCHS